MTSPSRSPRPYLVFMALLPAAACVIGAQEAQQHQASAPISGISYEVTADSAALASRRLAVTMTFVVSGTQPVILSLPAWSPGHYTLLWFARRVSEFSATEGGTPLQWRMRDFQTWELKPTGGGEVRLSFRYLADTIDRAVAWTRPNFTFFNGTNLFMYPVGRPFAWDARVTIRTEPTWRVTTSMDRAGAPNTFTSSNYHDLVDRPFFVGRFDLDSVQASNRWVRLATYPAGAIVGARKEHILGSVQRFVPQEVAVFGEAPFRTYTIFEVTDSVVNGGGLEHQDSQMDEVATGSLDDIDPSLYSHEFFHAWNVKRLRPADLVPYRYDDAQPTRWLWVSEGITDYYAQLALVRAGLITDSAFTDRMAANTSAVAGSPPVAIADASLQVWISPTDGTAGIYYPKGAATGFLLDILIRDASNDAHSLDDVMRGLYVTTYKRGRGFTPDEWWSAVQRAANGRSFTDFARRYVDGREPLPFDSVLPLAGLRIVMDTVREPRLGVTTLTDSTGVRIASLVEGGAAAAAGLRPGDQLISIGDIGIRGDASFGEVRARYAGTALRLLPVVLRRGGTELKLPMTIRLFPRVITQILSLPSAPARARTVLAGLLRPRLASPPD